MQMHSHLKIRLLKIKMSTLVMPKELISYFFGGMITSQKIGI